MSSARNVHFERSRALGSMNGLYATKLGWTSLDTTASLINTGVALVSLPISIAAAIAKPIFEFSTQPKVLLGGGLVYAGLGFPGAADVGKKLKSIAKYEKRETAENIAVGAGTFIVLSSAAGALLS
jgi:hypothetical protein